MTIAVIVLVTGVVTMILNTLLARQIVRSLRTTTDMLRDISEGEGDLTKRLPIANRDEIGLLAEHFNRFVDRLQTTIRGVVGGTTTLAGASTEISGHRHAALPRGRGDPQQSAAVAAAAEEMSTNMQHMAAAIGTDVDQCEEPSLRPSRR